MVYTCVCSLSNCSDFNYTPRTHEGFKTAVDPSSPQLWTKVVDQSICCFVGSLPGAQVHSGFWEGAKQHIPDIKSLVQQQNRRAGRRLPVWITGHSLGGGYANCMMLHLLANKQTSELFSAGKISDLSVMVPWQFA